MRLTLAEIARIAGGELSLPAGPAGAAGADAGALATGVAVDSRRVTPGDLFAAFGGATADGHDFLGAAFGAGAAAALVTRPLGAEEAGGPVIRVGDVLVGLQRLAAANRAALSPVVVGITGSTGKTSTKDLVASVASVKFATAAAERSYNNELGVPLTLLLAGPGTEVVVCELGARGPGQIAELCTLARPQIGVVTNVGVAHYELFGSAAAIADAKGELPAALPAGGVAVLNADDPAVAAMAGRTRASVVTYGLDPGAAVRAEQVALDRLGRASFVLARGQGGDREWAPVHLAMAGRHQVHNALAAAAAGWALGLGIEEIAEGLRAAHASPWRMEVSEAGGAVIVNDAYNANPTSVAAALETCAAMVPPGGRLLAVLGYMAELGTREVAEHEAAGRRAAALAQRLVVVGEPARALAEAARRAGLEDVALVGGGERDILAAVGPVRPGDVVLIKGSRVAGLERLAGRLRESTP